MKFNVDISKLDNIFLPRFVEHCEIIDIPAGSTPKTITVQPPGGDGARQPAIWNGSPPGLTAGDFVTIRLTSELTYRVIDLEATPNFHSWPFDTINVDAGGAGDQTTIQAAHNAASAGDTIVVGPGSYSENVTLSTAINLIFLKGAQIVGTLTVQTAASTIIDLDISNTTASGTVNVVQNSIAGTVFIRPKIRGTGAATEKRGLNTANNITVIQPDIVISDAGVTYGLTGGSSAVITLNGGVIDGTNADGDVHGIVGGGGITINFNELPTLANGLINGDINAQGGSFTDGTTGETVIIEPTGGPMSGVKRGLFRIAHILDGGHPANKYPGTRDADDAEFNNSNASENNVIGSGIWSAGWSPGAPATVDINSTFPSALYVRKTTADAGTDRYLEAAISTIGQTELVAYELFGLPITAWQKNGGYIALKLIDTSTSKFVRIRLDDDSTNGLTVIATYDSGSGETTGASVLIGHPVGPYVLKARRAASGGTAFSYAAFAIQGAPAAVHVAAETRLFAQSMGADSTFIPNKYRVEFHNTVIELWAIDSIRRTE